MKKQLFILIGIMFIITVINNMAHPVTPELVRSIGYGSFLFGALFATMSFANFLMSPFWGKLSDQFGRKPFMIMSPIGYGLAQIGFGFSTNPVIILLFRLFAGSFACAIFVCGLARLIDLTDLKERSKVMGIYIATTSFGANIGYLLGGLFGNQDYHYAFIAQATFSILSALLISLVIKESKVERVVTKRSHILQDIKKYKKTLLPFMLILTVLTSIITIGFNNGFNFYLKDHLDFTPFQIGILMAITGLIGLVTNVLIYPLIKRAVHDYYLLIISILTLVVTLSLATWVQQEWVQLLILIPFFAFLALYKPLLQSIISRIGTNNGEIMGLNNAFNALGNVIGSFYVGWVYGVNVSITFYSLALIGSFVFILLVSKQKTLKNFN